ncbi:MAG: TraB/GumN family protein [Spirosomaceae bacterium]|jgi:hypothetical protein|nr:TraB/GumN family protein [Spirosomataceae bacterium]
MKKSILFIFILSSFTTFAQLEKTTFWEVSGKDLKTPSYLFGTMHSICKDKYRLPTKVSEAITKSKVLFIEIDFNDVLNDFKATYSLLNKAGKPLNMYFTYNENIKIKQILKKKLRVNYDRFQNLSPSVLEDWLLSTSVNCKSVSYESELMKIAGKSKIRIASLETFEEHFATDSAYTNKEAVENIKEMLKKDYQSEVVTHFQKMSDQYFRQDIQKIYNDFVAYHKSKNNLKFVDAILDTRNKAWIPRIEKSMKNGKSFFAFGAAHLGGENGVINLLRKQGYSVKPLYN